MDILQVAVMRARLGKYPVRIPEPPPRLAETPPPEVARIPPPHPRPIPEAVRIFRAPVGDIAKIQRAVADYYKLSVGVLVSERRNPNLITARHVAIWLCSVLTARSRPEIGRFFGRDHSSIHHAIDRINDRMKSDPTLAAQVADLQARLTPDPK